MNSEMINGIFAIGGALVGVLGAWFIAKSGKEKKKLTIIVSPLSALLDVGDLASTDVKITYRDKEIKGLFAGEIAIQNTGNLCVDEIDLEMQTKEDVKILDLEHSSSNFLIPNEFYNISRENKINQIRINYLNPKDRIVFTYRISENTIPEFLLRKKGLNVETKNEIMNWIPDLYADIMFEQIRNIGIPGFSLLFSILNKPYKMYLESKRKGI